jgi:hypothetical protein
MVSWQVSNDAHERLHICAVFVVGGFSNAACLISLPYAIRSSIAAIAAFGFCSSFFGDHRHTLNYNCEAAPATPFTISSGTIPPRPKIPSSSANRPGMTRGFTGSLVMVMFMIIVEIGVVAATLAHQSEQPLKQYQLSNQ